MQMNLRVVANAFRAFLWTVKGLLLLIAVVLVAVWPMSNKRNYTIGLDRYFIGPDSVDYVDLSWGCDNGQAYLLDYRELSRGEDLRKMRQADAARHGDFWELNWHSYESDGLGSFLDSSRGPFRWGFEGWTEVVADYRRHIIAAPCWLVAPALALWPVASLALLIRHYRRQVNRERTGCCKNCGYDLRATAAKGGPILKRCPECGAQSAASPKNTSPQTNSDRHI